MNNLGKLYLTKAETSRKVDLSSPFTGETLVIFYVAVLVHIEPSRNFTLTKIGSVSVRELTILSGSDGAVIA